MQLLANLFPVAPSVAKIDSLALDPPSGRHARM